ncbi:hypothetical protein ACQF36_44150 [Streptomyces sp. Marseille-Q5077]|uniref:hypothetical protein n=1 Tax=Streptomyces sp. Marseille-Q5077 TaxID=3418995 RepID=UPI003CFD3045
MAAAGVAIVSTPLIWLLGSPDTGQLVGASIQGATGIAALVWALLQPSHVAAAPPELHDVAVDTGRSEATGGGSAHTGVRRSGAMGAGSARAQRTGDATARGSGSSASTGVDHTGPA